ncbi:YajQ family cyclic di-GMP-binding protein [Nostocoides sp. HKS02]|nr:YajQ family cyclic di-GMP-binding protein [Tetrasphaera sp. HKS02]
MDLQSTPIGRSGNLPWCAWKDSKDRADCRNRRPAPTRSIREDPNRMADSSFDIVSKIDHQEVANALNSAAREVATRYDFKNVGASIEASGEDKVIIKANTEERANAVLDVFQTWLVKRKVSLKHLDVPERGPQLSGKEYRLEVGLQEGISQENAKKVGKIIRDEGPKSVKSQIQGDELRVTSKSRDDLQAVQALLKSKDDLDFAIQFTNYR